MIGGEGSWRLFQNCALGWICPLQRQRGKTLSGRWLILPFVSSWNEEIVCGRPSWLGFASGYIFVSRHPWCCVFLLIMKCQTWVYKRVAASLLGSSFSVTCRYCRLLVSSIHPCTWASIRCYDLLSSDLLFFCEKDFCFHFAKAVN